MFGNVKELCPQDYIKAGAPGTMKRAYKLQEFVAHASNVNCLKIGKKSSRVLVTGGEDHKVNMWAIGKPNAILSLSGHSSAVESVTFDAAEVLVVAGAASGTIKLWDLEEAKIVRTLTGHRSNCIAVDFHPFGEFFASGSLDTNLKIWDIRRKGCIHTYKGHTRGVNAIKFSPDGRWVVSGGEDNIVKLWDLTAGKLMHDFKYHDGQISCLDFHPHEFLLATGSADRTVKFWDLETFELIGSAGPEASGVRSIIFNPDGRTLLCGLHENLKVFSWEPLRCHDVVDVGWSKLADLNIHEGKLLGCSFNQSCVGIWVVDLSCVGPYAVGTDHHTNSTSGGKVISHANQPAEQMIDGSLKGSNATRSALPNGLESSMKDVKLTASASSLESVPSTPQRGTNSMSASKVSNSVSSAAPAYLVTPRRMGVPRVQPVSGVQAMNRSDTVPVIVPRHGTSLEPAGMVIARPGLENSAKPHTSSTISVKATELGKVGGFKECLGNDNLRVDSNRPADLDSSAQGPVSNERISRSSLLCPETLNRGVAAASDDDRDNIRWLGSSRFRAASPGTRGIPLVRSFSDDRVMPHQDGYVAATEATSAGSAGLGRARALAASLERKERALKMDMPGVNSVHGMRASVLDMASLAMKGNLLGFEKSGAVMGDDEDIVEELMQQHNNFADIMQSRLTKLQVIRRFWTKNDLKGAVEAMGKMADQAVLVDVLSALIERSDVFNLEICTLLLPLLNDLLSSEFERYLSTALSILLLLVKNFGQVIHTTRSASPFFGVDLHAEERFERCNTCYIEMQYVMQKLTPLLRKGGDIGKSAQDLSIALQEV